MATASEKAPRHYAQEIALIPTLEGRRDRLKEVPSHLVEMVKTHLKIKWERRQ